VQKQLSAAGRSPGDLLAASISTLEGDVGFSTEQATRIAHLVQRAGPVAIELERLADRGFWSMTQLDNDYPHRLRVVLDQAAPPVLFGAGSRELLGSDSLAIVGSRDADADALAFARDVAMAAVAGGLTVASGGARGVDREASQSSIDAGGTSVVVAPEQLERRVREPSVRDAIAREQLVVASPYAPGAGFSVRGAMGRNRIVYALSCAAVVADAKTREGGTWAGAVEALKGGKVPVFVWPATKPWARALIELGARELPSLGQARPLSLAEISDIPSSDSEAKPIQGTLFDARRASADGVVE
jgi:predicted Rossmann fold nucleotide-binding protein DprA/Smf involved in DNA uptake